MTRTYVPNAELMEERLLLSGPGGPRESSHVAPVAAAGSYAAPSSPSNGPEPGNSANPGGSFGFPGAGFGGPDGGSFSGPGGRGGASEQPFYNGGPGLEFWSPTGSTWGLPYQGGGSQYAPLVIRVTRDRDNPPHGGLEISAAAGNTPDSSGSSGQDNSTTPAPADPSPLARWILDWELVGGPSPLDELPTLLPTPGSSAAREEIALSNVVTPAQVKTRPAAPSIAPTIVRLFGQSLDASRFSKDLRPLSESVVVEGLPGVVVSERDLTESDLPAVVETPAPPATELLAGFSPFDRESVERALDSFLGRYGEPGAVASPAAVTMSLTSEAIATAVALAVAETVRRRVRKGWEQQVTGYSLDDVSLLGLPGPPGPWDSEDA